MCDQRLGCVTFNTNLPYLGFCARGKLCTMRVKTHKIHIPIHFWLQLCLCMCLGSYLLRLFLILNFWLNINETMTLSLG